jgi:hypothetical protein
MEHDLYYTSKDFIYTYDCLHFHNNHVGVITHNLNDIHIKQTSLSNSIHEAVEQSDVLHASNAHLAVAPTHPLIANKRK